MHERESVLLSALLQDLGLIFQRTGLPQNEYTNFLPQPFQEVWNLLVPQQPSSSTLPHSVTTAYQFTTETVGVEEKSDGQPERLIPVATHVSLEDNFENNGDKKYYYPLTPLSRWGQFMPQTAEELEDDPQKEYRALWRDFMDEAASLKDQQDFQVYFFTLYFLLKKYFSRVPSLMNDVSYFDHARVTTALADCLYLYDQRKGAKDKPPFLLIEGGMSGIQNFIFNMVSPQQERAHLTKRLRGRSFYLLLLTETLADYLLKELGLTITSQLWCSGGHFAILAPNTQEVKDTFDKCYTAINRWLLKKFRGEIGCVLAWKSASRTQLQKEFGTLRRGLNNKLEREKMQKMYAVLQDEHKFQFPSKPPVKKEHVDTAPVDRYVQQLNSEQESIGRKLTGLNKDGSRLVKFYAAASEVNPYEQLAAFEIGENYRVVWAINPDSDQQADTVYVINSTDEKFRGGGAVKYGFKYLATHVDTYTQEEADRHNQDHSDESPVRQGEIKQFTDIAEAGKGGFLGVLRMDVDHLGAVFEIGIRKRLASLARIASLSSDIDLFFTGYFQHLCQSKFWENIYVDYAGGDDLFVVGAWDQVLDLACRVRKDFKAYTCNNPSMNISGGVFLCKGKYPIHRAAEHAKHLLDDLAKENENGEEDLNGKTTPRDAIAIFNHRIPWDNNGFLELKDIGDEWLIKAINEGKLNRTYLFKLLDLHKTWETYRHVNTARLYFITVRNIRDKKYREELIKRLGKHEYLANSAYIPMLVGYAGLKIRK